MQTAFIVLLVLVLVVAVAALGFFSLATPKAVNKREYGWVTGTLFAHRGLYKADQSIPENSLAAFGRAAEAGYGIELDVELTADDVLVVFHDDTLKRMTGVNKRLWDCTWAELRQLNLAGTGHKIPLFADVLKLVGGRVPLIVEIKSTRQLDKICSITWALLKNYKGLFCIESFNPMMVKWVKDHAPNVLRGQLSMRYKNESGISAPARFALENMLLNFLTRPQFIAYHYSDADRIAYRYCRSCGALTVAWTPRTEEAYRQSVRDFDAVIFEHILPTPDEATQGARASAGNA
jgi:glycerophosphoryl diester phosphodiesterase